MSYGAIPNVQFTINGGQFPPHGLITDVDSGPYAVVVTWMFASISMLAVAVRILTRRSTNCADRDGLLITAAEVSSAKKEFHCYGLTQCEGSRGRTKHSNASGRALRSWKTY